MKARWSTGQRWTLLKRKTSQYGAIQLNLKGNCTASGSKGSAAILNDCTYNVRTHQTEDDLDIRLNEVDEIKCDIIGLCGTYSKGE